MTLRSLLLSRDDEVVRVLRPTLEQLSIQVELARDVEKADRILNSEKFDAIIIDCDDMQGGREVLQGLRVMPSNKTSVAFAVLNGKETTTQEAFGMGVNFVLQKPITGLSASRCFHAALNFMVRERRRYYRQPVKMPVKLVVGEKKFDAMSTNISEGGIALIFHHALPNSGTLRLRFTLPETVTLLELQSEVAWNDAKGCLGLRFVGVTKESQDILEKWLSLRMENQPSDFGETNAASSGTTLQ